MHSRLHSRLRLAAALATFFVHLTQAHLYAASKIGIAAIGDGAPGGGQFLGPSLTGTPSSAGNGWVAFRSFVTNGGTPEQIVAKNMRGVGADAGTYVVAELGKSAGKADGKDLGSFKQFLGRPTINGKGDVAFVATLNNSERLPADLVAPTPAGLFLYRRSEGAFHIVALSRTEFPGLGTLDFATTIDIIGGSFTAIDVPERTPALNDAGDVAFAAATANGPTSSGAIFYAPGGDAPAPIVRLGDATTGGTFGVVGPPAINNGGEVVFRALLNEGFLDGVYKYAGGTTTPLVTGDRKVLTPKPSPILQDLVDFDPVVSLNDAGDVVFTAGPLFDGNIESNDIEGAPGVLVLHGGDLTLLAYPGQPIEGHGRITGLSLGPDGGNFLAPPSLSADGTVVFFAALNAGGQQALFRVAPPYDTTVLLPYVLLGGSSPDASPVGGTFQAASSAAVVDGVNDVTLFARIGGAPTSEALLFLRFDGGAESVLVGQATPTKGLFAGPPFSGLVQTDSGDVLFKSFVAAGPSGLGLFRWRRQGGVGDLSVVVRTGDAAPLKDAPTMVDLVGDPSANDRGDVAFTALVGGVGRVVLVHDGAGIRKIAATGEELPSPPAPAGSGFRSVATDPMVFADGTVVFRGTYDYPDPILPFEFLVADGLFAVDSDGGFRILVQSGQDSPAGMPFLRFRDASAASGPAVAFRATLGSEFDLDPPLGLFVVDVSSGAIRTVAVQGQATPEGLVVREFSSRPGIDAAGSVTFTGTVAYAGREGVAIVRQRADGGTTVLAQVGSDGPSGGRVKGLSRVTASSSGHVAFRATFDPFTGGTPGFFLATDAAVTPLLLVGESDDTGRGGRLSSLNPAAALNSSDHLAVIGSRNEGTARNGIFLASPTATTVETLSGKLREASADGKGRDVVRGRVLLRAGDFGDGFDLAHDAVTLSVSDVRATYFSATLSGKKLKRARRGAALRRPEGALKKLRVRTKKSSVQVTFAAMGLDLLIVTPPLTVRLDVGDDSGVVTVPCTATETRITCPGH